MDHALGKGPTGRFAGPPRELRQFPYWGCPVSDERAPPFSPSFSFDFGPVKLPDGTIPTPIAKSSERASVPGRVAPEVLRGDRRHQASDSRPRLFQLPTPTPYAESGFSLRPCFDFGEASGVRFETTENQAGNVAAPQRQRCCPSGFVSPASGAEGVARAPASDAEPMRDRPLVSSAQQNAKATVENFNALVKGISDGLLAPAGSSAPAQKLDRPLSPSNSADMPKLQGFFDPSNPRRSGWLTRWASVKEGPPPPTPASRELPLLDVNLPIPMPPSTSSHGKGKTSTEKDAEDASSSSLKHDSPMETTAPPLRRKSFILKGERKEAEKKPGVTRAELPAELDASAEVQVRDVGTTRPPTKPKVVHFPELQALQDSPTLPRASRMMMDSLPTSPVLSPKFRISRLLEVVSTEADIDYDLHPAYRDTAAAQEVRRETALSPLSPMSPLETSIRRLTRHPSIPQLDGPLLPGLFESERSSPAGSAYGHALVEQPQVYSPRQPAGATASVPDMLLTLDMPASKISASRRASPGGEDRKTSKDIEAILAAEDTRGSWGRRAMKKLRTTLGRSGGGGTGQGGARPSTGREETQRRPHTSYIGRL